MPTSLQIQARTWTLILGEILDKGPAHISLNLCHHVHTERPYCCAKH